MRKVIKTNKIDLLYELVKTDFSLRYRNSVLGFVWVLMKPLILFLILLAVFSVFIRSDEIRDYPLYLLLGIIMFNFFSEGTTNGLNSLVGKSNIILKVNFPRQIAVVSSTVIALVNYGLNLIVFLIFSLFYGRFYLPQHILFFVLCSVLIYLLILGVSFFTSILYARFRDLQPIWELGMQVLFYLTPIIYPFSFVEHLLSQKTLDPNASTFVVAKYWVKTAIYYIVKYNPLSILIQAARSALISREMEFGMELLVLTVVALILLMLGFLYFRKNVRRIAEKL